MEIIKLNIEKNDYINDMVVTIGEFDGIHTAHMKLINKVIEIGFEKKFKTGMITFDPHPDFVLRKQNDKTYITPLTEKIKLLEKFNIDYLLIIPFSLEVANLLPKDFIKLYLLSIGVKEVVVGFDFHYGKNGAGTAFSINVDSNNLIKTTIIDEIKYKNEKIGSSKIKDLLKNGYVKEVAELMGRPYRLTAKVIKGSQIGSKIGIPTANLSLDNDFVLLKSGVYAVKVKYLNSFYLGICNIGHNPSFNFQNDLRIEVHIIDFHGDLYNENLDVEFYYYLRDEMKFSSVDDFKSQILKDIEKTKKLINNI